MDELVCQTRGESKMLPEHWLNSFLYEPFSGAQEKVWSEMAVHWVFSMVWSRKSIHWWSIQTRRTVRSDKRWLWRCRKRCCKEINNRSSNSDDCNSWKELFWWKKSPIRFNSTIFKLIYIRNHNFIFIRVILYLFCVFDYINYTALTSLTIDNCQIQY